jgi:hypothetical protein
MTNNERLRSCRRERKAILKSILDANKIREAHLLIEIAKDRAEDRFVKELPF